MKLDIDFHYALNGGSCQCQTISSTRSLTIFHKRLLNQFDVFHCSSRSPSTTTSLVEIMTSPLVHKFAITVRYRSAHRLRTSQALFTLAYSKQIQTLCSFYKRAIIIPTREQRDKSCFFPARWNLILEGHWMLPWNKTFITALHVKLNGSKIFYLYPYNEHICSTNIL